MGTSSECKPALFSTSKNQKSANWGPARCGVVSQLKLAAARQRKSMASSNCQQQASQKRVPEHARFQQEAARIITNPITTPTAAGAASRRRSIIASAANGRSRARASFGPGTLAANFDCLALLFVVATSLLLVCGNISVLALAEDSSNSRVTVGDGSSRQQQQQQQQSAADTRAALEAELNSILQQQDLGHETNSRLLSEAIISRLMLGNLTDISNQEQGEPGSASDSLAAETAAAAADGSDASQTSPNGLDSLRLRRILSYLQNYELAQAGSTGSQAFSQYPVLPASQAATIKRASVKMSNYLRQQAQQQHAGQRQLTGYGRMNNFDFGLGKRPDSSVSSNILRFGDSASAGGHMAAVSGSGLGKRPSAHRYDFGLGKRVASPAYPRYDFGLGKRAPNRIRYDFGLGK
uniref:Helicostatins n=1 Tax=Aceria tosichella TaxID=561515 RepID=A0A6G1SEP1_9ACAR